MSDRGIFGVRKYTLVILLDKSRTHGCSTRLAHMNLTFLSLLYFIFYGVCTHLRSVTRETGMLLLQSRIFFFSESFEKRK